MLQNHYGDHEYPVRPRARHARAVQQVPAQTFAAAPLSNRTSAHRLRRAAPALALWTALLAAQDWLRPLLPLQLQPAYLVLATLTLVPVMICTLVIEGLSYRSLPLREQLRYRELSATPELTARRQQLLALDAHSDYAIGAWNSSLEYAPAWRCMPDQVRRTWEHALGTAGTPGAPAAARGVSRRRSERTLFQTLPMASVAAQRADIDTRYHLASGRDAELYVADLLTTASATRSNDQSSGTRGMSARFAAVAAGPDGDRMIARLSSLTGRDETALRTLTEPDGGRGPELLAGADVQWAISVVRLCYVAEHLDAATAWGLIERAGTVAAARFASWEEYWASVRAGVAFGSDSLEAVQRFDAVSASLRVSAWPAARVSWLGGAEPAVERRDQSGQRGRHQAAGPEAAGGSSGSSRG